MIEAFLLAIADRPIRKERRVTFAARLNNCVFAGDVQKSFLLAGEARIRQILSRRAAADRDIHHALLIALAKPTICFPNLLLHLFGKFAFQKKRTQCFARGGQRLRSFFQPLNFRSDFLVDLVFAHEKPEGIGCRRETIGHAHALFFQGTNHLTKGSILPADLGAVPG